MTPSTRIRIALSSVAVASALMTLPLRAQTVVQQSAAPPLTNLFSFQTHTGAQTDRVVVAKFVVNNTAADLELRLLLPASLVNFRISEGNKTVPDPEDPEVTMATVRLRDMTTAAPPEVAAAGYRIIKATVTFSGTYDFAAAQTWTLQTGPTAPAATWIGYWAQGTGEAATEALVTRPRLIDNQANLANIATYTAYPSPKNISFGEVHINLSTAHVPKRQWEFANVGTAPLSITNVSAAPTGAYTIESFPAPPLTVLPMSVFSRQVTARPTALGPVPNATVTLTAAAPANNVVLNLTGTSGVRLNSAILFDLSGSMLSSLTNQSTSNPEHQKMRPARIAALELVQLYRDILPEARLSLYTFPNAAGDCPSSAQVIPPNTATNNFQAFQQRLDVGLGHSTLINPAGTWAMTPMAEGIARVYDALKDRGQHERAAVFLFGDGEHNCNSAGARPTPASWYTWSTFRNAGIPFFTIPYGATYDSWIQTYQALASNTNGEAFPADITSDLELQIKFKKALGKALELESLLDPIATVNAGQVREHGVCVSESAEQAVFSVHWATRNPQAISFTLRDPTGATVNSGTAASSGDVSYFAGENFANYVLRGARLAGSNGAGEWTLRVQGNVTTSYAYQVYSKDAVQVQPQFDLSAVMVPAAFAFRINDGLRHLQDVNVTASSTAPTASINNFLATTHVSRELIERVPEHIGRGASRLAERKLYALTHFTNTPPPVERSTQPVRFTRQASALRDTTRLPQLAAAAPVQAVAHDLIYHAPVQNVRHAGLYEYEVQIRGVTKLGSCFQRHYVISRWVDVALTPALVAGAIAWQAPQRHEFLDAEVASILATDARAGYERRFITFTPRDEHGNYLGLGRADEIAFVVNGADRIGGLQDLADGTYAQLVEFRAGTNPTVQVSVADVEAPVVSMRPQSPADPESPRRRWWLWLILLIAAAAAALSGAI